MISRIPTGATGAHGLTLPPEAPEIPIPVRYPQALTWLEGVSFPFGPLLKLVHARPNARPSLVKLVGRLWLVFRHLPVQVFLLRVLDARVIELACLVELHLAREGIFLPASVASWSVARAGGNTGTVCAVRAVQLPCSQFPAFLSCLSRR